MKRTLLLFLATIYVFLFLGCTKLGEGYFVFSYTIAISCVDSEKTETLNITRPIGNNDRNEITTTSEIVETDYNKFVDFSGYLSEDSPINSVGQLQFDVSYFSESSEDVYVLVLAEHVYGEESFPSELFTEGDIYSYLEDEELFHETLQTLYENDYWGIKKLTPADESITITYKEALGE